MLLHTSPIGDKNDFYIKPLHFTGDLDDEDEVLAWITDDETLEIPGKIEEVNVKMLDKILAENDHVVVFFCKPT